MLRTLTERFRSFDGYRSGGFHIFHIPGLIYRATGEQGGHTRLFKKPIGGIKIASWNQSSQGPLVQRWHFFTLMTLVRVSVEPGQHLFGSKEGWSVYWPSLSIKREYLGFSIRYKGADPAYTA